jgi:cytochrome c oxidase cbb3-type subunit 2
VSFHTSPRLLAFVPFALFGALSGGIAWLPAMQMNARYPEPDETRPPSVQRGREVWLREGCSTCHTQQVRSDSRLPLDAKGNVPVLEMDARYGPPSRAEDYAGDDTPTLGTQRTGPDLFNVGQRVPSADWHFLHLYDPRAVVPDSIMPSYPWLFHRADEHDAQKDRLVIITDDVKARLEPDASKRRGARLYATPDAQALVDYLLWLRAANRTQGDRP